ncbi:MAG: arginine--tRNA ligase [Chloroflexota bacterium]|nr:MAG: arginine--tRNA ligase [Chloroflexota bacterium]
MIIKTLLANFIAETLAAAQARGDLPPVAMPEIVVERPQRAEFGDYATSLPLKLARAARMNPRAIAEILVKNMPQTDYVESATVAAPGFINFVLRPSWVAAQVDEIIRAGAEFGHLDVGQGQRVQVEYVSANPTGPLHVGHGRGAVLGSTLVKALAAAGFAVESEYYLNDAGNQIDAFNRTLYARYAQALGQSVEVPHDGYMGTYMVDLAQELSAAEGDRFLQMPPEQGAVELGVLGLNRMTAAIKEDLERLRVEFDSWFSERTLYEDDAFAQSMAILRGKGHIEEREGAVWFSSSQLGDDRDSVVIRTNGSPTYFASDIAYHYDKFERRHFDRVIDIWGADHMGHVARVKAVVGALGFDPAQLQVLISQLVTLRRGDEILRLSKRTGDIITMREVIEEVGADACRFFFLTRSADSQMDFDLELAVKQSQDNPVYYVQYAHARIASILRLARERGIDWSDGVVSLLTGPDELELVRKLLELPELVQLVAQELQPHHLPHYAQDLAAVFHSFYNRCRVISPDVPMTAARLKLVEAAQITLANSLHLMGIAAPDRM